MNHRPIGVFDSGLGGLTAFKRLRQVLPREDIIYLGDTGRVPYGSRSREIIIKYAREDIAFLRRHDIKAIVVACGTVSTTALEVIAPDYPLPVFGVVLPAAQQAAKLTRNGKIGLIGTQASIRSGAYDRHIRACLPQAEIFPAACPLFVPLVENGRIKPGDVVIETIVREYLTPLKSAGVDTLILGCTHYPLLAPVIRAFMGPGVTLIDTGAATAEYVARQLGAADMLSDRSQGSTQYFVTDAPDSFAHLASLFLERDVAEAVTQVSLDAL